jgi:hypothetical protein
MAYIGKQPVVGNFQVCDAISVVNGQAAYTMQVASTNVEPENANHMLVSLNGILQKPGSSFTISGATITFASNLATGDVIDFIILLGDTLNVGTPSDDSVGAAQIKNDLISGTTALSSAPDDTDEFLVSDAGTLKRIDYSLIKGGGAYEKLLTTTASDDASVSFSSTYITSTYRDYKIIFSDVDQATAGQNFYIHLSSDNGSSYLGGTSYDSAVYGYASTPSTSYHGSDGADHIRINGHTMGNDNRHNISGEINIVNPLSTSTLTMIYGQCAFVNNSGKVVTQHFSGFQDDESLAINNIKLSIESGNITSGTFTLYGRKN